MRLAFLAAPIIASLATFAHAAGPDAGLFGPDANPKLPMACFKATYDKAWLDAHPKQNISAMTAFVAYHASEDPSLNGWHDAHLIVTFRDSKVRYAVYGGCGGIENGRIGCGVDCDGGAFEVQSVKADQITVNPSHYLRYGQLDSAEVETPTQGFRDGDKDLRLVRTELTDCLPVIVDDAMRAEVTRMLAH